MASFSDASFERKAFYAALAVAAILHVCVLAGLVLADYHRPGTEFQPLAVMEFAHFDPEGGEPGGGEGDEDPAAELISATNSEPLQEPEKPLPESQPTPELEQEVEPENVPDIIESVAEQAAPAPVLPVKPKVKPKTKDMPKPQAKPTPKTTGDQSGKVTGGVAGTGQQSQGGGTGKGRGGIGGGTGQGNPSIEKAYLAKIRNKINRNKKYPPAAKSQKLTGVVTVNFTINRQGAVTSFKIVKGSGHSLLDQEVTALMKRVSPFPPMPKEMTKNSLNLTVPIQFTLQ